MGNCLDSRAHRTRHIRRGRSSARRFDRVEASSRKNYVFVDSELRAWLDIDFLPPPSIARTLF